MAQHGIVFSTKQEHAFERRFSTADQEYNPDGRSFWHRSSGFRFVVECDTTGLDLAPDYADPRANLAVQFSKNADNPEGVTALRLVAAGRRMSYVSDRQQERPAMDYILGQVLRLNLAALDDPDDVLEYVQLFNGATFIQTQEIQKTYDPYPEYDEEKHAIHLSLTRGVRLSGRRRVVSKLELGRAVECDGQFYNYWQTLHSDFHDPSVMKPQTHCFNFMSEFYAPSLGRSFRGDNPEGLGRLLSYSAESAPPSPGSLCELQAFEARLRAYPGNQFIGGLSVGDAVQLVAAPLDDGLYLRT